MSKIGNTPFDMYKKYEADNNGESFTIVGVEDNQDNVTYNVTVKSNGETRPGTISVTGNNNGQAVYTLTAGRFSKTLSDENNGSYMKYRKMARRNHKSRKMARKNRKSRNTRRNRRNYSLRI